MRCVLGHPRPLRPPKPAPRCPETPFLWLACSGTHARGNQNTLGRPPRRQAFMLCTGAEHMFGHAMLHAHAHAHAHTRLHVFGSAIHDLRAQRLASGCRYGNQAARRRLVENVECAASESRLSTLRGSAHAIAQKPHVKWKTCHAHSCAWAWACHLQISIVAMCLETQFDATSPKTTATRDHLDEDRGA